MEPGYALAVESLPTPKPYETLLWCRIIDTDRHGMNQVIATWQTPAGPLCQHHCTVMFPDVFSHRGASPSPAATTERMAIANYKLAAGIRRRASDEYETARKVASRAKEALEVADEQLAQAAHSLRTALEA